MRTTWLKRIFGLTMALALAFGGLAVSGNAALAAPTAQEDEVEFTGTVSAIDESAGTLTVDVDDNGSTTTYTVIAPDGFDFSQVEVGDTVEVEGLLNEDGDVVATSIDVEDPDEIEFTGTVTDFDESEGTLTVEVEDDGSTTTYTVIAPEDFDFSELENGDTVEVEGTLNEDGDVVASKIEIEDDEEDDEGDKEESFFCSNLDESHPFAQSLADSYDVSYEQVMAWFCEDELGFGQIMLALQTAENEDTDASADELLTRRTDGEGWGQIWQDLDLIGRPEDAGPPGESNRPDDAGPPADAGPPEWAGAPEDAGPPADAGPSNGGE